MRKWLPLVTVCLGTFMLLIDVTVVNVALPDMARDLRTSFESLQWVVDAYALTLAALVLGAGSIADLVGHRRAYVAGLAGFAAASLACGLAPNAEALVAARAVQGVGAAVMFATTFALLNSNYSGRERGIAYGLWGAVAGASAAVGPIVGGLLTEGVSWRWIFFVNLPVSVLAITLCLTVLQDAVKPYRARVDIAGMVAFTGAAGALTYGLIRANERGWAPASTWSWLVAVPVQRGGMAAGAVNTFRQLGFALGIAALGSVFAARAAAVLSDHGASGAGGSARALAGGQARVLLHAAPVAARPALDADLHAAAVSGLEWSFAVSGVIGVAVAGLVFVMLRRPRPRLQPADLAPQVAERELVAVG